MARRKLAPHRRIEKKGRHTNAVIRAPCVLNPAVTPPTQVFTSPDGIRGEVLRLGTILTASKGHMHVLLLPGNPGVIEYYRPTLRSLWRRFPEDVKSRVSLHALGYPGHDLRQLNGLRTFTIAEHTEFLKNYVDELKPSLPDAELVLMGHSYGSYVALRLAQELGDNIACVSLVMLMPALWQMGTCAGWLSRVLLQDTFGSASWLAWGMTAFLPPVVRDALIAAQGHRQDVEAVTRMMVDGRQRGLYLNICALGRDEMYSISEPGDLPAVSKVSERSLLVYVDVDKWLPLEAKKRILKAFGKGLVVKHAGDGVSHGFCLFKEETEKVVKVVAPWLCERLRSKTKDSVK